MEFNPLLEIILGAMPSMVRYGARAAKEIIIEIGSDLPDPNDFEPNPRVLIKESGLLDSADLSFGGIDKKRAVQVIELANGKIQLPHDIRAIEDAGLKDAAFALESEGKAYSRFVFQRRYDPKAAIRDLFGSRAVDFYIRKTWIGYCPVNRCNHCGTYH